MVLDNHQPSSATSISTAHDTTFSSDADSAPEVGSGEVPIKPLELTGSDVLSLPISVFDLSFDLPSGKDGAFPGLHSTPGPDVLRSLTNYPDDTKFEDGDLTTSASADTSF